MLIGCMATASSISTEVPTPAERTVEQMSEEMLELAKEMDQERSPAIYVVIISEPEIIIANPLKK